MRPESLWAIIARVRDETANDLSVTLAAWLLAIVGWGGLASVVLSNDPRIGPLPLWAFYVLWLMAATGTAVPFVRYLSKRFAGGAPPGAILRTSLWVGFFFATCAWLQLSRLLNSATAALLLIALIGVEWFLRLRDRSRWEPDDDE
jgi:hypothetical protein